MSQQNKYPVNAAKVISSAIGALLFCAPSVWGQLSGVIRDENGEPLAYATVYARNTTKGTVANSEGQYRLALERGEYDIVFQYIGYKQRVERVVIGNKPVVLNVQLEPISLELAEVVISDEDPAYSIMRKAIAKRDYYRDRTPNYSCDVYIKGFYKVLKAPQKVLGQEIGDLGGILDSNRTGVVYLSESVSKLYVQGRPPRVKEVMVLSKVSGNTSGYSLNRATLTEFNLYEQHLSLDREILSPLADNAFSYYYFRLLGRLRDNNGYDIYKIEVQPKRPESPAFFGHIYIADEWWNLTGVDLRITGKAIHQPILDTLSVRQEFALVNKPDQWCLLSQHTALTFGLLGFRFSGFFYSVFSNYDLTPRYEEKFFGREQFRVADTAVTRRDTAYWNRIRPVPLTAEEALDYVRKDSLEQVWESKAYMDSLDRMRNRFKPIHLFAGYTWRNSYRKQMFTWPSPLEGIQFNTVQGWVLDVRPSFRQSESRRRRSRYWEVGGVLNYGFSEQRLRASARVSRRFESIFYTQGEISGGRTVEQFDPNQPISIWANQLYSLLARLNYMKLYEKTFLDAQVSRYLFAGLRMRLKTEWAERRALVNTSSFSQYRGTREYTPNTPLPVVSSEPERPFFEMHRVFRLDLQAHLRFGQKYSTYPDYRVYSGSKWPDLTLSFVQAIPGIAGSTMNYQRLQIEITQTDWSWGLFGYLDAKIGAGAFLSRRQMAFMDYFHPRGNQTIFGNRSEYLSSFFLLPYYEYSTDGAYAYAHLRHHFNGWVLEKLPLVRKLGWREVLCINAYHADRFAVQPFKPTVRLPYWEVGWGLYNIGIKAFRPFHIDIAAGFFAGEHYRTGVVLGMELR
ncbi:MAG: DUF5686 and carboxypeptidase regulatory-like domain-containing protein [Saprospiraceae bacterium]|nr:DUF5686 and carboxypeptidase regulatory-like domain-containing protein [Saprospiraceae bacterium]MDW8484896.1 DUF5686 and carboxypeptidase regulatory-like domain-containing protein [Saprospiraceae bacterium]